MPEATRQLRGEGQLEHSLSKCALDLCSLAALYSSLCCLEMWSKSKQKKHKEKICLREAFAEILTIYDNSLCYGVSLYGYAIMDTLWKYDIK